MKKEIKPIFQCEKCGEVFIKESPGPTRCIFCNHLYVAWLNFEEFIENLGKYGRA